MRTLIALALIAALCAPALAGSLAGIAFPDGVQVGEKKLVLNGMALRTKLIFKVYVAGLYLPAKESDPGKILAADGPRRMVMHFLRKVESEKISEAWKEGLKANTPNAGPEVKQQFDQLSALMEEMKEGERLQLTYIPGEGTSVEVKGKVKGTIVGKAFADALLACWIGLEPGPGEDFKKALLAH